MATDWPDFNDDWNYSDPAGTEAKFRARLPEAEKSDDASYRLQLLTQIARAVGLQKRFDEAHALLDQVEAQMAGGDVVEVRYLLESGRVYNSSRQPEQAVPLFLKAAELAERIGADFYAVDALHMLGIAAPQAEQLDWNQRAIAFAERSPHERAKRWLASLYNNTGWSLFDERRYDEALDLFQKALVLRQQQGDAEAIRIARWCVAKMLRVLGRVEEGLAIQRELEQAGGSDGFVEEEIAECLHALGKPDDARPYFRTAYEKLSQTDGMAADTARLERLKALGV